MDRLMVGGCSRGSQAVLCERMHDAGVRASLGVGWRSINLKKKLFWVRL